MVFRKRGRVLPNVKWSYNGNLLETVDNNYDVHNSYYFKHYNTFIAIFNKHMDIDEFNKTIELLKEVNNEIR